MMNIACPFSEILFFSQINVIISLFLNYLNVIVVYYFVWLLNLYIFFGAKQVQITFDYVSGTKIRKITLL